MPNYDVSHVLMLTDASSGVWSYCLHLAAGLARNGVRTTFAVQGDLSARQREGVAAIPGASVESGDLLGICRRAAPDLVHANSLEVGAMPWDRPMVLTLHGERAFGATARNTFGSASLVIAPTAHELMTVEAALGPAADATVIYHGRDASEYVVGGKKNMVFTVGAVDDARNLKLVESIAPRLEWPIYWAGASGERRPYVENLVPLGRVCSNAITAWYSRAAIFALPSRREPYGISVLEAALCGCALVLGDTPEMRELWSEAALFLDPEDESAWLRTVNRLATDAKERRALADAAVARAKTYSARNMVCSTLFAYQEALQSAKLELSPALRASAR